MHRECEHHIFYHVQSEKISDFSLFYSFFQRYNNKIIEICFKMINHVAKFDKSEIDANELLKTKYAELKALGETADKV